MLRIINFMFLLFIVFILRIKELETGVQNMAADFQLLEADHARRREQVDQLSTTVELVEEENRKLHKVCLVYDVYMDLSQ